MIALYSFFPAQHGCFLVGVCLMQGEIFIEIKCQYVVIINNNRYNEIKTYKKEVKCDE
jgi:hypothetical protein